MTLLNSPTTGSFTINRHFAQPPGRVFAAYSDPSLKAQWFVGPKGGESLERTLDVRPGGSESLRFRHPSGMITHFIARYHAVAPDQRIVFSYDLMIDGRHHSTSLVVVELTAASTGTDMIFTEHSAWHDGTDRDKGLISRENGTSWQLDSIAALLARSAP
jgi:uncharacterized protein YndB with AHSA1/START domain